MSPLHARKDLRTVLRRELVMRDVILQVLADGPKTIVQVAEDLGEASDEVLMWMMAMRRYGLISEVGEEDDDGYFAYQALEKRDE